MKHALNRIRKETKKQNKKELQYTDLDHLSWSLGQEVGQDVLSGCQVFIVYNQTLFVLWNNRLGNKSRLLLTSIQKTTYSHDAVVWVTLLNSLYKVSETETRWQS